MGAQGSKRIDSRRQRRKKKKGLGGGGGRGGGVKEEEAAVPINSQRGQRYQRRLYGRTSKCKESFSGPVAKMHSVRLLSPLWYVNVRASRFISAARTVRQRSIQDVTAVAVSQR